MRVLAPFVLVVGGFALALGCETASKDGPRDPGSGGRLRDEGEAPATPTGGKSGADPVHPDNAPAGGAHVGAPEPAGGGGDSPARAGAASEASGDAGALGAAPGSGGTLGDASAPGDAGSPSNPGAGGHATSAGAGSGTSACAEYCNLVRASCAGTRLQYQNLEQCLTACEHFPAGNAGAETGNSVACRLASAKRLSDAGGDLDARCREAGPDGGDRCGTPCDAYCAVTTTTCTEEASPTYFFESIEVCLAACAALPNVPFVYGDATVVRGNSVQCRLYHAVRATARDTAQHCVHALGVSVCK
jgi:hypothetical protein